MYINVLSILLKCVSQRLREKYYDAWSSRQVSNVVDGEEGYQVLMDKMFGSPLSRFCTCTTHWTWAPPGRRGAAWPCTALGAVLSVKSVNFTKHHQVGFCLCGAEQLGQRSGSCIYSF